MTEVTTESNDSVALWDIQKLLIAKHGQRLVLIFEGKKLVGAELHPNEDFEIIERGGTSLAH